MFSESQVIKIKVLFGDCYTNYNSETPHHIIHHFRIGIKLEPTGMQLLQHVD
jgi:hypothetical protein